MSSDDKKELLINQLETSVVEQSNDPNDNIATSSINSNESIKQKSAKKQSNNSKSQVQRDYEQLNRFLSPMLDDLDKLVATNLKEMDKMEELVQFFLILIFIFLIKTFMLFKRNS